MTLQFSDASTVERITLEKLSSVDGEQQCGATKSPKWKKGLEMVVVLKMLLWELG